MVIDLHFFKIPSTMRVTGRLAHESDMRARLCEPVPQHYEVLEPQVRALSRSVPYACRLTCVSGTRSYDTFVRSDAEATALGLQPSQVYTTPNGFKFVKKAVREGILPMIETELLSARKRAKKQMKEANDPLTKSVYDGKQLALKVCCNSIYGFTGSNIGPIPMIPVSSSVTAIGRQCIEDSKEWM